VSDPTKLFRKVSLERLSSPEQLDMVMEVTPPRAWIALGAVGSLLIVVTLWGIFGTIPEKVTAQGILLRRGGITDVPSPAGGQVAEIAVVEGQEVAAGDLLVRIAQPALVTQLRDAEAAAAAAERQHRDITSLAERDGALRQESLRLQREKLQDTVKFLEERLVSLAEQMKSAEELQARGLVTRSSVLSARQSYFGAQDNLRAARAELQQLEVRTLSLQTEKADTLEKSRLRLEEARRTLERLKDQVRFQTNVLAPKAGRVLELKVNPGSMVGAAMPLVSLQQTGGEDENEALEALIYVPPTAGKNVRLGMEAQVSPSTAKREEFGFLIGKVRHVAEFPSTREGMMRVLPNPGLIQTMSQDGPPFAVYADLLPDPNSASGYRWSSRKGDALKIGSGTMLTATIVVRERRPIGMVIPLLREYTGI
jgi:HlyD family secretion protein